MELLTLDFMQRLRRYSGSDDARMVLLNWMRKANLLLLQHQGAAQSQQLIEQLAGMLEPVMESISILGAKDHEDPDVVWILEQVCRFYDWLKYQTGQSEWQIMRAWREYQPDGNQLASQPSLSGTADELPLSKKTKKCDAEDESFRQSTSNKPVFW